MVRRPGSGVTLIGLRIFPYAPRAQRRSQPGERPPATVSTRKRQRRVHLRREPQPVTTAGDGSPPACPGSPRPVAQDAVASNSPPASGRAVTRSRPSGAPWRRARSGNTVPGSARRCRPPPTVMMTSPAHALDHKSVRHPRSNSSTPSDPQRLSSLVLDGRPHAVVQHELVAHAEHRDAARAFHLRSHRRADDQVVVRGRRDHR